MTRFEDTLCERWVYTPRGKHNQDWLAISREERDAIVDALGTLREIAEPAGEHDAENSRWGGNYCRRLALGALARLDGAA
jgi:hypothetical protein